MHARLGHSRAFIVDSSNILLVLGNFLSLGCRGALKFCHYQVLSCFQTMGASVAGLVA